MNDMVTITKQEYDRLCAAAEDLADLKAYDSTMTALESGDEELIPAEFVNRILNGENALKVYRELRGYTQAALAQKANVNRTTVGEIEISRKTGSVKTLSQLADALAITVDDLI